MDNEYNILPTIFEFCRVIVDYDDDVKLTVMNLLIYLLFAVRANFVWLIMLMTQFTHNLVSNLDSLSKLKSKAYLTSWRIIRTEKTVISQFTLITFGLE